jgi:hypothetical protein
LRNDEYNQSIDPALHTGIAEQLEARVISCSES